ncbi:DUF885 family protein [Mycoplasma zalophi]|uniref:DUF885 family protein n=1 Tax=Mycoplasma zalophi TaxID=191287 RepID=UPI001C11E474|nr:DUF885 family protein [Mycoplasma zalophi]MBU4691063.1 DUF885 family protein [Mycoplasma zalophi]
MKFKKRSLYLFLGTAAMIATISPAVAASCTPSKVVEDEKNKQAIETQLARIQDITRRANNFINDKLQAEEFKDSKIQLLGILQSINVLKDIKDAEALKAEVDSYETKYLSFKENLKNLDEIRKSTSKYVDEITKMYETFLTERENLLGETAGALTDETKEVLLTYEKAKLAEFQAYLAKQISTSERVWIGSIITKIQQDIALIESDIRYVGGDALILADDSMLKFYFDGINDQLFSIRTHKYGEELRQLNDSWTISIVTLDSNNETIEKLKAEKAKAKTDEERLEKDKKIKELEKENEVLNENISNINQKINEINDAVFPFIVPYINQLIENLKSGVKKDITNSKVYVKQGVSSLLVNNFADALERFFNSTNDKITLQEFLNNSELLGELTPLQKIVKMFLEYYGVEYLTKAHGEGLSTITLSKTNFSDDNKAVEFEKEDTYVIPDTFNKIYGLGYTNGDLAAKNVGLGGMKNKEAAKKIYEALLFSNLTIKKTAQEIYNWGVERSRGDLAAFEFVANKIATLVTGSETADWTPTVKYNAVKLDATPSNPASSTDVKLNIRVGGKLNIKEWYKWLTQDDMYYGLEATMTPEKADQIIKDPAYADYVALADSRGFEKYKNSEEKYDFNQSITNKQMYASGLEALKQYNIWREKTQDFASSYFNKGIENVKIIPVKEFSTDLGSYSNRAGAFFFNLKPYMGLPKWSTTSFVNHESKMGHHNQLWYTKSYGAKEGDKKLEIFDSTAYAEGWALFMEWFAIETGWYGTPDYSDANNYDKIPRDFYHAIDGYLPALANDEKASPEEIAYLKEVAGGTYWNLATSVQKNLTDTQAAKLAIQIGNLMQYYGAINEATLRDNRLALDTALHGIIDSPDEYIGSGISINDQREFMKKHLQLPSDINAYPKRYLGYLGQATSYNTGKEVMKDIYKKVQKASGKTRKEFAEDKETLKKMFNLYLSYGNIPLEVLEELVISQMIPNADENNKY